MRNYRKRAYYDPMSDSTTPMSQSELASEAEAVFGIVFDDDPNALLQRGAYGKIFDHFKRYGISNDYSDAVSMANYIEKNLLKHSHRANRKTSSDVINELWFDRDTGDVYEIWIDGNYVVGYNLTFEGGPFTVSEVAGEGVYSPSDFRLQRDGVVSKNDITVWGLVPIDTLEKGQAIEIIERNGYPMPASLGHARDSHRANRKGSINEALLKELMDEIVERERETGGWGAGDFNSDIEEVLWRRMTSPHKTKRLQDDLGVPIDEDWRYDAEGLTDLRFISVREFLHDQRWEDIFDVEYGSQHLASHRANHKTANRPNEQQKKDFINPARELTSVDYGESHDGSYYMSFGLGGVPNAVMVRIGDDELERVLEGLGHYYSFSADGYSFYLSYDNWEIWDHNGNGGFTISIESMNVVHDGLFEIFLNDGMPHTSSRRRAYKDDTDLLLGFLDGDMDSGTFGQLSSPGQDLDRLLLDILDSYEARNVKDLIDWYHGLSSPVERDLSELSGQGAIDLSTIEGRMAELIEHNLSHQI